MNLKIGEEQICGNVYPRPWMVW